ncbi:MAG: DUF1778 domain-containing protein [Candidatus Nanopelagicales bacterium]|nr:DUF1778 domain-containing protein [Candidatus Nanopelagicales bacterium]
MATTKNSRLAMRLTNDQDTVIRRAADLEGRTITEFSIAAIVSRAQDVLADQRVFALDPAAFREFQAALDRPVSNKPRLEKLFADRSVFDD